MFKTLWPLAILLTLTGCTPPDADQPGVYADGENFIVINPVTHRINYAGDGTTAEALLAGTQKGLGISYTTWRDKESCGLNDGHNLFAVPRHGRVDRQGATFSVENEAPAAPRAGEAPLSGQVIAVRTLNLVRVKYLYDNKVGIRYIDQYDPNGEFERRIWLERGIGFLGHCRGFSVDDYR